MTDQNAPTVQETSDTQVEIDPRKLLIGALVVLGLGLTIGYLIRKRQVAIPAIPPLPVK